MKTKLFVLLFILGCQSTEDWNAGIQAAASNWMQANKIGGTFQCRGNYCDVVPSQEDGRIPFSIHCFSENGKYWCWLSK